MFGYVLNLVVGDFDTVCSWWVLLVLGFRFLGVCGRVVYCFVVVWLGFVWYSYLFVIGVASSSAGFSLRGLGCGKLVTWALLPVDLDDCGCDY